MRSLAIAITRDKRIRIRYDPKMPTPAFMMETNEVVLSLEPYPSFVKNVPRIAKKVLDGDLGHELGHLLFTKPLWEYFNNWITKIKRKRGFYKLAHELCNIVEDKRINHFIILRYRFDIGKRLLLANLILKDMIDNTIEPKRIPTSTFNPLENLDNSKQMEIKDGLPDGVYMVAILCDAGLYEAKCTKLWKKLSPEATKDMKTALKILEDVKYKRLRIDIIRASQQLYDLIAKHLEADYTSRTYVVSRRGGDLKGEISEKLKQLLEAEEKKEEEQEKEKEEQKNDLLKGSGAGEGTGEEIPAPEPDFAEYQKLLDECKPEITELLNRLKKTIRPRCSRQIFQKRGRMMSPIIPRIYTNSFRGTIRNVYTNVQTTFEKEKVAIGFLFDFSGSVDKETAQKITTVLNEVFGHYVDDYGFSISCFGADSQKVKTFFETFENTRARIGGISVNPCGTEVSVLLEAYIKMFNTIKENRRKILVIASDFCFTSDDEVKAEGLLEQYAKAGIELILIGFCSCEHVYEFAQKVKNLKTKRTHIKYVSDLPSKFLDVYLSIQT
jgi:hypothetical protein